MVSGPVVRLLSSFLLKEPHGVELGVSDLGPRIASHKGLIGLHLAWVSSGNAAAFQSLRDPNNNIAFGQFCHMGHLPIPLFTHIGINSLEMHQYLDSDGSGTSGTCVSSTIGAERLAAATAWLKQNNFKGFLGEIGGGSNGAYILSP